MNNLLLFFISFQLSPVPDDSLLFRKGYEAYLNGNFATAESILIKHKDGCPTSPFKPHTLYLLGEINFKKSEYQKAIEWWRELNQTYPETHYAVYGLIRVGDAYFSQKRYGSALKAYRQAEKYKLIHELRFDTELKIYECEYYQGKYPSLVEALIDFVNTYIDSVKTDGIIVKTMLRISRIYITKKEYYSARIMLQRLLDTYPHSPDVGEAMLELATVNKLLGDNDGYKRTLFAIISLKDTLSFYPSALIELANLYSDERKYDSSLNYWMKLKEIKDYQDRALKEIANIYYKIGFVDEAMIVLQSLIKDYPESKYARDAFRLWSDILRKQGNLLQANDVLSEFLKKNPRDPEILFELGNIHFELGDYTTAINYYLLASELFKDRRDESAQALLKAGDTSLLIGDTTNARHYYLNAKMIAISEQIKELSITKINQIR